ARRTAPQDDALPERTRVRRVRGAGAGKGLAEGNRPKRPNRPKRTPVVSPPALLLARSDGWGGFPRRDRVDSIGRAGGGNDARDVALAAELAKLKVPSSEIPTKIRADSPHWVKDGQMEITPETKTRWIELPPTSAEAVTFSRPFPLKDVRGLQKTSQRSG